MRSSITKRSVIIFFLIVQFITLVMFPPESFSMSSQEWWLPVLLAVMTLVAVFRLVLKGSDDTWPWYLMGFAQGFNIISRLMMLMPHSMVNIGGTVGLNTVYIILTVVSMLLSTFFLWYFELPEVRINMIKPAQ